MTERQSGDPAVPHLPSSPPPRLHPAGPVAPGSIRCGEHADYGTLTFLLQDSAGGLEVKSAEDGWILATPVEDTIVVSRRMGIVHVPSQCWCHCRAAPTATPRVAISDRVKTWVAPGCSKEIFYSLI